MSTGRKIWAVICIIIYSVLNTGFTADALVWAPETDQIAAKIQPDNILVQLSPGQATFIHLTATNIAVNSWTTGEFYLQLVLPTSLKNYPLSPIVMQPMWSSQDKTLSYKTAWQFVEFGQSFNFNLPLTAPNEPGYYRFYFQPIISGTVLPNLVTINLKVGHPTNWQPVLPSQRIEVSLNNQTADIFENQFKLAHMIISTGKAPDLTPPGRYVINKKLLDVLSDSINLQLPYWMELRDLDGVYEGYGLHGLPYALVNPAAYQEGKLYYGYKYYSDGKLYTGYNLLGQPMSQGCVVFSLKDAEMLYDWADLDKTLVNIN